MSKTTMILNKNIKVLGRKEMKAPMKEVKIFDKKRSKMLKGKCGIAICKENIKHQVLL